MNSKDYKQIAGIIKDRTLGGVHLRQRKYLSEGLADLFEREQPCRKVGCTIRYGKHFNRQQFLKDCGVEK